MNKRKVDGSTLLFNTGSKFGYHGVTYGLYADRLVEKVDPKGRSTRQVFLEDIAEPFGNYSYKILI